MRGWAFIRGNNKQYWKWKQYAHMGVDSCISSHHRHYLHRARPWAHISAVCRLYNVYKRQNVHTHISTHLFSSSAVTVATAIMSSFSFSFDLFRSFYFLLFLTTLICLCYLYKTKMKIHCVYTPHSVFMCKYLRALFFPAPSLLHFSIYVVALVFITFSFSRFPNNLVAVVARVILLLLLLLLLLLSLLF